MTKTNDSENAKLYNSIDSLYAEYAAGTFVSSPIDALELAIVLCDKLVTTSTKKYKNIRDVLIALHSAGRVYTISTMPLLHRTIMELLDINSDIDYTKQPAKIISNMSAGIATYIPPVTLTPQQNANYYTNIEDEISLIIKRLASVGEFIALVYALKHIIMVMDK